MKILFCNGHVLTMDGGYAEAVLVSDGVIEAVGDRSELSRAGAFREVDLGGGTLMPSFIDPHSHIAQVAGSTMQVSLAGAASEDEIAARISAFISKNGIKPGEWVKGCDYEIICGSHPKKGTLDSAAPENPVVIQHRSGHFGVFSTSALEKLGIDEKTSAPEGGEIEKDAKGLTGLLSESAYMMSMQRTPMPSADDFIKAFARAQEIYASYGITTAQEGYMVREMQPIYDALLNRGALRLDVVGYPDKDAYDGLAGSFPKSVGRYDRHFKIGGIKMFLDGSPQGRTAWMRRPYEGEKDYCSQGTMSDEAAAAAIEKAAGLGVQILAHANGDAAAAQYIRLVEKCGKGGGLAGIRPVMIHAQLVGRDQLADMKRLGIIPSFFVAHVYEYGETHIKNFGMERASHISPAMSALLKGMLFTFHQDSPVMMPDMLHTVQCAAMRRTSAGRVLGEDERIPVRQALDAVTKNAAYQYFEEGSKGSIARGMRADLVLLSGDPLTAEPGEIENIRVLATWKDGELIYEA